VSNVFQMPAPLIPCASTPAPTRHTSRLDATSLLPSSFAAEFDVVNQMLTNRKAHCGNDKNLSLYGIPSYIMYTLERMQADVPGKRTVGLSPLVSCCLSWGVRQLQAHNEVQQLVVARKLVNTVTGDVDAEATDAVAKMLRNFQVAMANANSTGAVKRKNFSVSGGLYESLDNLADALGAGTSPVGIMAITMTLSTQVCVLDKHRGQMEWAIGSFMKRVYIQRQVASGMMAVLDESRGW